MEEYQYTPLSSTTSIRVLVLHISKTDDISTTSFSLEEADLQADPKYEALSYTWGETTFYNGFTYQWNDGPTATFHIKANSSGFLQITKNLHEFLEYLVDEAPLGDSTRMIWADQVCINQNDIQERNSQVAMMRDIYAIAWRTLIWIGKQDVDMIVVSDILHAMTTPEYDYCERVTGALLQILKKRIEKVLAIKSGADWQRTLSYTKSIINILNKPWFSRAWIIQEAALSREPLLILGSNTFDLRALDSLMVIAALLETKTTGFWGVQDSNILRARGAHTLRNIQACRRNIEDKAANQIRFLDILRKLAFTMDATDARDQVYAFLAFQNDNVSHISPDYSLQTSDAYTYISAFIASSTKSLSILGLVRGAKFPWLLPSWAIDWRLNRSTQGPPFDRDGAYHFEACRGYPYEAHEGPSILKVLRVSGKVIGQVAVVSSVTHNYELKPKEIWKLEDIVDSLKEHITIPKDKDDLFRRVMIVLAAYEMNNFKSDVAREIAVDKMLLAYRKYDRVIKELETHDLIEAAKEIQKRRFISFHKRVFYSGNGLFGLGPELMQENDVICILHGSVVPCILRKRGNEFMAIGQCYYENWMHGDLVDWSEDEGDAFDLI